MNSSMFLCKNPIRVKETYRSLRPSGYTYVPCGKCSACLSARASTWTNRLKVEASQHKYVFFLTLTYSDDMLPRFYPEEVYDYKYMTDLQRGEVLDYLKSHFLPQFFHPLRYYDVQLFLKKLRSYIYDDKHIPSQEKYIRFFCCGEYGETTFRPHYHLLIFSDSDKLCSVRGTKGNSRLFAYVRKAWSVKSEDNKYRVPIGRLSFECARDKAAGYCSKYLNSFSNIPEVLQLRAFRPFCKASQSPSIGSFKFTVGEAKQIVLSGVNELDNKFGSEFDRNKSIPLYKSLKDSLFPKVVGYPLLSDADRYAVYGAARFPYLGATYSEFRQYLYENQASPLTKLLLKCVNGDTDSLSVGDLYYMRPKENKSLVRLWRQSNSVLVNCSMFGIDLHTYVDCIDRFYCRSDMTLLREQLAFEEAWSANNDIRYLLSFIDKDRLGDIHNVTSCGYMRQFGFSLSDDFESFDFNETVFYKSYFGYYDRKVYIGKSYKAKSDYIMNGKFSNINLLAYESV